MEFRPTEKTVEKHYFLIEELKNKVIEAENLIRKGYNKDKIRKRLKFKALEVDFMKEKIRIDKNEIYELAKGLIYVKKKKRFDNFFFINFEAARYCFDKKTAELRAKHLKDKITDKKFADLSCGYSVQSFEFLKYAKEAVLIDKKVKPLFYTFLNSILLNIWKKIVLIKEDSNFISRELKKRIKELDFIYSEPYREKSTSIENLSPNPFITIYYNKRFLFDFPIAIEKDIMRLKEKKEFNIAFIENKKGINRLTISNFIDPFYIVEENLKVFEDTIKKTKILPFMNLELKKDSVFYEVYKSAVKLNFIDEVYEYNNNFFTIKDNNHIKNKFKVVGILTEEELLNEKEKNYKNNKVILRFSVNPSKYYGLKETFEKKIDIEGTLYVFKKQNYYIICQKI